MRGAFSTSETPVTGTRCASSRSVATASRQPCDALVSSNETAPDARSDSRPVAASRAAGPPCSTVSAAVTVTTRSVSTSAGFTRNVTLPACPSSTRSSASASCTITRPLKRRRNSGGTSKPISRGDVRRSSPPATRIVTFATPKSLQPRRRARPRRCRLHGLLGAAGIGNEGLLDHHRGGAAGRQQTLQRLAGERKRERSCDRGRDVLQGLTRGRRTEDHVCTVGDVPRPRSARSDSSGMRGIRLSSGGPPRQ